MSLIRPHSYSAYMEFAKLESSAKFNLATSGVMNCTLGDLGLSPDELSQLDIHGPDAYGHQPLLAAIAKLKGVTPNWVVEAAGTSMANHLAMSALFAPDDEVLIEEPTYGLLLSTAQYLGASVRRFQRRFEDNYALDVGEVAKQLTAQTRLIVLTNMHNPSSAQASQESLRAVGELAAQVGARVLVDEVYLETLHHPSAASCVHFGPHFVATSSLTKAYGLSGLRCGWILAEPMLASRMWKLNDLFSASPVHLAELLSVAAIDRLDFFSRRADALLSSNRKAFVEMLGEHPAIDLTIPEVGTTAFPRLRHGDVSDFCRFLRERYETSVVPGTYFERAQHVRIGLAGDPEMTREGLVRLAEALHSWVEVSRPVAVK